MQPDSWNYKLDRKLAALEDANCRDAERIHNARRRIERRQPRIESLRRMLALDLEAAA